MFLQIGLAYTLSVLSDITAGLECYSCTNATSLVSCSTIVQCPAGSICHNGYETLKGRKYFTLGCKPSSVCPHISTPESLLSGSGDLVGRSVTRTKGDICSDCCDQGLCNRQLCQHDYPQCSDSTDYDCSGFGAVTNLCWDTNHVKNLCKRFCGLCSLVDGVWSPWGSWTSCDVTCESGSRSRVRQCDNPTPAHGGDLCPGENHQSEACVVDTKCPVDGGWTYWASWDACSTSCDIGLQKRRRSCTNPSPAFNGYGCPGDDHEEKICTQTACADGNWSSWGHWSGCPVTCGGGLTSRTRSCDNPAPSITGKYCTGNPTQSTICNNSPCTHRAVAFKAHDVVNASHIWASGERMVFSTTILNTGHGYDKNTGLFTAPESGSYFFTVHICTLTYSFFEVAIVAQGIRIGTANLFENDHHGTCVSGTGVAILGKGGHAWVEMIRSGSGFVYQDGDSWNSFSGVLMG